MHVFMFMHVPQQPMVTCSSLLLQFEGARLAATHVRPTLLTAAGSRVDTTAAAARRSCQRTTKSRKFSIGKGTWNCQRLATPLPHTVSSATSDDTVLRIADSPTRLIHLLAPAQQATAFCKKRAWR